MKREGINRIVDSLKGDAIGWTFNGFEATHRASGVSVWVANSYYGVHINVGGIKFGGVTAMSSFFGYLIPWRRRVLNAVRSAAYRRGDKALSRTSL